jgi:hypothetical protein
VDRIRGRCLQDKKSEPITSLGSDFVLDGNQIPVLPVSGFHDVFFLTTLTFAIMTCLIMLWPKNKPLMAGALIYAFYIGLGVSVTIHWFSEFVAGAIIGSVCGTVVGTSFKTKLS